LPPPPPCVTSPPFKTEPTAFSDSFLLFPVYPRHSTSVYPQISPPFIFEEEWRAPHNVFSPLYRPPSYPLRRRKRSFRWTFRFSSMSPCSLRILPWLLFLRPLAGSSGRLPGRFLLSATPYSSPWSDKSFSSQHFAFASLRFLPQSTIFPRLLLPFSLATTQPFLVCLVFPHFVASKLALVIGIIPVFFSFFSLARVVSW